MPVLLTLNDIIELKIGCWAQAQAGINVLHYKVTTVVPTSVTASEVAVHFDVLAAPLYKAALSSQAQYYGVTVQKIVPLPPSTFALSAGLSGPGLVGSKLLPTQVCGMITKQTDFAGRKYRGRIYVPFPDEESNEDTTGTPELLYIGALTNIANGLLVPQNVVGALGAATLTPVLLDKDTGGTVNITGGLARDRWAGQHRRGNYGQSNVYPPL